MKLKKTLGTATVVGALGAAAIGMGAGSAQAHDRDSGLDIHGPNGINFHLSPGQLAQLGIPPGQLMKILGIPPGQWKNMDFGSVELWPDK